jgi:hypothetical protein
MLKLEFNLFNSNFNKKKSSLSQSLHVKHRKQKIDFNSVLRESAKCYIYFSWLTFINRFVSIQLCIYVLFFFQNEFERIVRFVYLNKTNSWRII